MECVEMSTITPPTTTSQYCQTDDGYHSDPVYI